MVSEELQSGQMPDKCMTNTLCMAGFFDLWLKLKLDGPDRTTFPCPGVRIYQLSGPDEWPGIPDRVG